MYLTGDGLGSWEEEEAVGKPVDPDQCPGAGSPRRLQEVTTFDQTLRADDEVVQQPIINRPLLMSMTTGLQRSLWSLIISKNTFQRDRFERATKYYFASSLDWILHQSGIAEHGLNEESDFIPRAKCLDSCDTAADGTCTDGGFDSQGNATCRSSGSNPRPYCTSGCVAGTR
eukprot:5181245-Prymnesium_polylepis.1